MSFSQLAKKPSAVLPITLSFAAFLWLFGYVALFGIVRQADEGAPARIFQLLIVAQFPIIGYFAVRWLPRAPRPGLLVLALQAGAALIPITIVMLLESGMY